jgi:hypothetical protein
MASIFRVEVYTKQETIVKLVASLGLLVTCFMLVSLLAYFFDFQRRNVTPKRQLTLNELHGVISQRIELFVNCVDLF